MRHFRKKAQKIICHCFSSHYFSHVSDHCVMWRWSGLFYEFWCQLRNQSYKDFRKLGGHIVYDFFYGNFERLNQMKITGTKLQKQTAIIEVLFIYTMGHSAVVIKSGSFRFCRRIRFENGIAFLRGTKKLWNRSGNLISCCTNFTVYKKVKFFMVPLYYKTTTTTRSVSQLHTPIAIVSRLLIYARGSVLVHFFWR